MINTLVGRLVGFSVGAIDTDGDEECSSVGARELEGSLVGAGVGCSVGDCERRFCQ